MKLFRRIRILSGFRLLQRYRTKWVLLIAISWTVLDLILWAGRATLPKTREYKERTINFDGELDALLLRIGIVLLMSVLMGWLLVFRFKTMFRGKNRLTNLGLKALILLACSFVMNFLNLFAYFFVIQRKGLWESLLFYWELPSEKFWLLNGVPIWMLIFLLTQLLIEINEKYSPGVFYDIIIGRYNTPVEEQRIVLFVDLKDSTPIAETLGHRQYFTFIREFIFQVSTSILDHNGRIYQYVGDEIVTSWPLSAQNATEAVKALIDARRLLQNAADDFRRDYNITPEFRAGLHAGPVMVGEIGIIKKDLAMSGDTMNTTARIRSACSELNQRFIASADFMELSGLKDWQTESLGSIELKGKKDGLGLFALRI